MTTKVITNVTHQPAAAIIPPRLLGTLGMIGAPFLLLEGVTRGFQMIEGTTPLGGFLELFYLGGWTCSLIGLGMLQATGRGKVGKAILGLLLLGLVMATAISLSGIFMPNLDPENGLYQILDIAWPLSHTLMLVVGSAVLVVKRLSGWTRFAPLACGLAVPLLIVAKIIGGEQASVLFFGFYTWIMFTLLGYAVRNGERA